MDAVEVAPQQRHANGWALAGACVAVALQLFILGFIVPRFVEIFREMDVGELPPLTNALVFIARNVILVGLLLGALVFSLHRAHQANWLVRLAVVLFLFVSVEAVALFMPLIMDVERMHK